MRGKNWSLNDALQDFAKRLDRYGNIPKARAVNAWGEVVGSDINSHTMGAGLRDGEMLVFVDSAAWANELSMMAEDLRSRVNSAIGEDLVTSIRFAVSSRVRTRDDERLKEEEKKNFYARDESEPTPLTPTEVEQVAHSASVISNEKLREAAIRATIASLERKKAAE
jgi:hypothetical protein